MPTRTRRTAAAAPVETVEDEFEELDELEEDAAEEEAPALKSKGKGKTSAPAEKATKAAPEPGSEFNSNWLAAYVTEETGVEVDSRTLRMLLRKMAKDGQLAREVGVERQRYIFPKGKNDPIVKIVIRRAKAGDLTAIKTEGLDKVKANKAAPAKSGKKAAPVEDVEEMEELPEEIVAPVSKSAAKTKTSAKAAPAKAAPSTATRRRAK